MTPTVPEGWTLAAYIAHQEALREADVALAAERDRRYAEVNAAAEKALHVKDAADAEALRLAKKAQDYRDERHNNLEAKVQAERLTYVTKPELAAAAATISATVEALAARYEAAHKPLADYVTAQQGKVEGRHEGRATLDTTTKVAGLLIAAALLWLGWQSDEGKTVQPAKTVTVTVP